MLTRRTVIALAGALLTAPTVTRAQAPAAREHAPKLDIPILTEDPVAVPVTVWVEHPMGLDHYIRSIRVWLPTDPVPDKGVFAFTPLAGRAWVSFQMRSGAGGVVHAEAEDIRHGRFQATAEVRVAEGGCGVAPDKIDRSRAGNPVIRLPRSYRTDEVIEVRAKIDHSSHTGLVYKGGTYVREMPAYYLTQMLATLDGKPVCDFTLSPAISPNPLIRFSLRISGAGTLRVSWRNSEGKSWEAAQPVRPA